MLFLLKKLKIIEKVRKLALVKGDVLVLQGHNLPELNDLARKIASSNALPDGIPIVTLLDDIEMMKLENLPEEAKSILLEKLS
jgi:hypothetical protein